MVTSPVWFNAKAQFLLLLVVSLALLAVDDVHAYSFCLGGLVYVVPNLYFVHYAFRYRGAKNALLIARSFSWGESGKIALAVCGFILVYRFVHPLNHAALFSGFLASIIIQWFVAFFIVKSGNDAD